MHLNLYFNLQDFQLKVTLNELIYREKNAEFRKEVIFATSRTTYCYNNYISFQVNAFTLKMLHYGIKTEVLGFFEIDSRLLFSVSVSKFFVYRFIHLLQIASSVASYIIILVQFNENRNKMLT
jgi:hypothetical protein